MAHPELKVCLSGPKICPWPFQDRIHDPISHPSGSATARNLLSPKCATPDDWARRCRREYQSAKTSGGRTGTAILQRIHKGIWARCVSFCTDFCDWYGITHIQVQNNRQAIHCTYVVSFMSSVCVKDIHPTVIGDYKWLHAWHNTDGWVTNAISKNRLSAFSKKKLSVVNGIP